MALPSPEEIQAMMDAEGAQPSASPRGALPLPAEIQAMMDAEGYGKPAMQSKPVEPESFLGSLWSDIKSTPKAAYDMVASIPSGVSNLAHLPKDLYGAAHDAASLASESVFGTVFTPYGTDYDRAERTLRGIAGLSAGVAGGGAAGLLAKGIVPAAIGSSAALTGVNDLNQLTGSDAVTTNEEDARLLRKNITQGLVVGGALKAANAPIKALANNADEVANALDRKSIGTRQSDYGSASETRTIETPDGIQTGVKIALDDLLESGKLGKSRNPSTMLEKVKEQSSALTEKINDVIVKYDKTGSAKAKPNFDNSMKYLESGKVPADMVPAYLDRLGKLEEAINAEGKGSLSYLQQQKVALGKSYDATDAVLSGFNRSIYNDLKTSIEKYAPEVKTLNAELGKYKVVEPILNRSLKIAENTSPLSKLRDVAYTTGGIGAPAIAGASIGGAPGLILGAGAGLAGKAIASPSGQAAIARGLRATGNASQSLQKALSKADPSTSLGAIEGLFQAKPQMTEIEVKGLPRKTVADDLFSKKQGAVTKKSIKAIEQEIDQNPYYSALYEVESGRNPKAKNPKSTAKGAFQFIDDTAKRVGLKDSYDLGQSFEAVQKLTQPHAKEFGEDPRTLYAAHFLGATLLRKVLNDKPLKPEEEKNVKELINVALPRFEKIYQNKVA